MWILFFLYFNTSIYHHKFFFKIQKWLKFILCYMVIRVVTKAYSFSEIVNFCWLRTLYFIYLYDTFIYISLRKIDLKYVHIILIFFTEKFEYTKHNLSIVPRSQQKLTHTDKKYAYVTSMLNKLNIYFTLPQSSSTTSSPSLILTS